MITVYLKIEGVREKDPMVFKVQPGITISEFLKEITDDDRIEQKLITDHIYDQKTGEIGIYMVVVNNKMVTRQKFDSHKLIDEDSVTLIMPVGGG